MDLEYVTEERQRTSLRPPRIKMPRGMEGETTSIENGVHRHFNYSDMVRYIRANVIHFAKV